MHSALPARAPVNAIGLRVPYRLRGAGSLVRPVQQCFCLTGACGFGCSLLAHISVPPSHGGRRDARTAMPVPDQAVRHLAVPAVVADRDIRQRTHARRDPVARRHCGLDIERFRHSPFAGRPRHDRAARWCADARGPVFRGRSRQTRAADKARRIGADAGTSDTDSARAPLTVRRSVISVYRPTPRPGLPHLADA